VEGIGPALTAKLIEGAPLLEASFEAKKLKPDVKPAKAPTKAVTAPAKAEDTEGEGAKETAAEDAGEERGLRRLLKGGRKVAEAAPEEKRHAKIAKKEREEAPAVVVRAQLSPEQSRQMGVRQRQKANKADFRRHDYHKKKRLSDAWRKPMGLHNKKRQQHASEGKLVKVGFGAPRDVRGRHPSGFEEVLVHAPKEMEQVKPGQAVRIAGTVGLRKRLRIELACEQRGIRLLNPSNLAWEEEGAETEAKTSSAEE